MYLLVYIAVQKKIIMNYELVVIKAKLKIYLDRYHYMASQQTPGNFK